MASTRFPPHFAQTDHRQRSLNQMRSKQLSLEKYIYLNGLKGRDSNLFYDILLENMQVSLLVVSCKTGTEVLNYSGNDSNLVYTNCKVLHQVV